MKPFVGSHWAAFVTIGLYGFNFPAEKFPNEADSVFGFSSERNAIRKITFGHIKSESPRFSRLEFPIDTWLAHLILPQTFLTSPKDT